MKLDFVDLEPKKGRFFNRVKCSCCGDPTFAQRDLANNRVAETYFSEMGYKAILVGKARRVLCSSCVRLARAKSCGNWQDLRRLRAAELSEHIIKFLNTVLENVRLEIPIPFDPKVLFRMLTTLVSKE